LFIYLNICTRHKVHEHNVCTTQIDNHRHKRFKAALTTGLQTQLFCNL